MAAPFGRAENPTMTTDNRTDRAYKLGSNLLRDRAGLIPSRWLSCLRGAPTNDWPAPSRYQVSLTPEYQCR